MALSRNQPNIAAGERAVSGMIGGLLMARGLLRPSLVNTALAAAGAVLLERGLTGHCALYSMFDIDTARHDGQRAELPRDPVDEASDHSFPASDPPAWTGSATGRPVAVG